jgi:predicted MPP superfamily phosphohydrolase
MTFRWLHLSDTHFREDELWDRRATLRALITKVAELKEKGLAPDMVFVTGDIAWSGKPKEYEQATRFFHELNKVLDLDPKDRWFLVPGNHDVDRSRIKAAHRAITASLQNEATVEELLLRDPDSLRSLSTRLEAYYNFAADFLGPARASQPDRPWRTDVREFDGVSIGILQLNSAWIAEGGKADEANLLVGEAQVREALDATPDAFLRIALMHHPLRNFREFDANRVKARLSKSRGAAFLLRGHLHLNDTESQQSPDGHLLEIAAGTLYTDETNWPRGFHVGEIDLEKGEARIHLFRYSGDFFASDNLTYENAPNGVCKIKLPAAYRLGGKKTKTVKTISEEQRLSLTARYRIAAANYHGHARFIGFPNQAARPNARVSDLFVPLRMKAKKPKVETESRTTAEIAQRLLGPAIDLPARIVVLGDPGSGKTTLSRFLVMLAAGAITLPGVEVAGEPLPLRIAFRDFAERQRDNPNLSLLDYLELQAKTELSLALPKNFLRNAIENGQAILLFDGLDEVGAPEHRTAMRDLVAGFSAAHSKLPVLVTSRIAGYDDASLGEWRPTEADKWLVLVRFEALVLEQFDDNDLRTFVSHWYSVQEPTDPVARDRGIADLMAALNADDRVRELARTPILATLIAMIHRVEANLPGERAKLYELCVRMLLETWPVQAKRPFTEIDPGLQRAYLESLAFQMQMGRQRYSREAVTIERNDLVAKLLPILRKRDFATDPKEKVTGVITRWINHLEKHSGIVVEQSTGVYSFFHLSIMEYLAAQGMERELGQAGAVDAIAEHFDETAWQEVCVLNVGAHAEDGDFLDKVYKLVSDLSDPRNMGWDFLLRCLREEACFRPEQRDKILGKAAARVLKYGTWNTNQTMIDLIRRFSVRHGNAVQRWIDDHLNKSTGDELAATAAIVTEVDYPATLHRLANRRDQTNAAGALIEFWPGSSLGAWAVREAAAADVLNWSKIAPHDLVKVRALSALGTKSLLAATSLIALNEQTLQWCVVAAGNRTRVANLKRPGGRGLPDLIRAGTRHAILTTTARTPRKRRLRSQQEFPRTSDAIPRDFAYRFAQEFAGDFDYVFPRDFAGKRLTVAGRAFCHAFANSLDVYLHVNFKQALTPNILGDFIPGFALGVSSDLGRNFSFDFQKRTLSPPLRLPALHADQDNEANLSAVFATIVGEARVGLATMAIVKSDDERLGYVLFRIQNRWLFEIWSPVDKRLPENPSPAQLALYFALGWAQSTTTWAWPDSDRWRTLFAAGPGEHWLVRSQWHLCKLTDDPSSKEDDAALRAALRDGLGDDSLPGYATRLSEVLGIES